MKIPEYVDEYWDNLGKLKKKCKFEIEIGSAWQHCKLSAAWASGIPYEC